MDPLPRLACREELDAVDFPRGRLERAFLERAHRLGKEREDPFARPGVNDLAERPHDAALDARFFSRLAQRARLGFLAGLELALGNRPGRAPVVVAGWMDEEEERTVGKRGPDEAPGGSLHKAGAPRPARLTG
jgi:hypothetical protein